jgi:rhomboid protease GluP
MNRRKKKKESATKAATEGLMEFDRRLKELGRYLPVTAALIAVNIIVWVFMVVRGVPWLEPSGDALKAYGANYGPLTTHGEGWRLLTACFLHAGIVQLLVNQWALWQYGRWLERLLGHFGFALLYLITAFASSLVAVCWQPDAVLAGSTGPIAGLIGALAAFCWRVPDVIPKLALGRLRASTFAFLGYNIGVEMYRQRLDAAGFLSGLAVGFAGGLILSQPIVESSRPPRFNRNAVLAAAGFLLVIVAAFIARPKLPDPSEEFDEIRESQRQAIAAYQAAINDLKADRIDAPKFIERLGNDVLLPWHAAKDRLKQLDARHLGGDAGELVTLTLEAMDLREQGWNLIGDSIAEGSTEGLENAAEKFTQADHIEDEIDAKLKAAENAAHSINR